MREAQRQAGQITKYDRHCRSIPKEEAQKRVSAGEKAVVRLKVPDDGEIAWIDAIRGEVRFQLNSFDDQVLLKSDGFPTYHFAVVIDDHLMKITHVLRGEEWISSTPKHLLLYKAFNWEVPVFAHMPLIRNADKSKLSKRKNDVSILSYRDKGYLPEALLNFIALLGWSHPEQKEIFSLDEFLRVVSLERVQKTGPIFDTKKLDWMNGVYIRELPPEELKRRLEPYLPSDFPKDRMEQILPLILERLVTLKDVEALSSFFYRSITIDPGQLVKKSTTEEVIAQLEATRSTLETLPNWEVLTLETAIRQLQEAQSYRKSQYFMALRLVMTGQTATPPLFDTISVLGKEQSLSRISTALDLLKPAKTL